MKRLPRLSVTARRMPFTSRADVDDVGRHPDDFHVDMEAPEPDRRAGRIVVVLIAISIGAVVAHLNRSGPAPVLAKDAGWSTDWDDAIRRSGSNDKPVLVLFTADWCPACRSFETKVLARPDVREYLQSRYTLVMIDMSHRDGPNRALGEQYKIEVYPTLILYSRGGGREVARCYGLSAKDLVEWLRSDGRAHRQIIVD